MPASPCVPRWSPLPAVILAAACQAGAPASWGELPRLRRALEPYGLVFAPAATAVVELGWQAPPEDCPHAYRLRAQYEPALRFEADDESSLIVGRHPRQQPDRPPPPGPIPADLQVPAHLFYQGRRAERVGATRDVYFTGALVGPAAPTAACMPRAWDPMEDALALGWPRLPGRLTAVEERWNGLPVGGRCSRSACVDPWTGEAGPKVHQRPCVTPPWRERLAGLFDHEGELYAWIHSTWSDGNLEAAASTEHETGGEAMSVVTERYTLVSVDHGRPLWSRTRIDYGFPQPVASGGLAAVVRTWTLESIDACSGSLAAAGWSRTPKLVEEGARLRDRLAHTDELRRTPRRPQKTTPGTRPRPDLLAPGSPSSPRGAAPSATPASPSLEGTTSTPVPSSEATPPSPEGTTSTPIPSSEAAPPSPEAATPSPGVE